MREQMQVGQEQMQAGWNILIAALGGAAVGVERQWSGHATGPRTRFAGIRTFTLLGGIAGASGWLWAHHAEVLSAVLLAGAVGLIVAAYAASTRNDVEATTEVAALVVLAAGVLAGLGYGSLTSAIIAITALLLVEKSRLHSLVEKIPEPALQAGFRFAFMALIILPLLPEGPFGPWGGLRPRELWMMVLFFSGLSFLGYAARSLIGAQQGYVLAGLLGGMISSTNVTYTFARNSRTEPGAASALALGVLSACTLMFIRVWVACAALYFPVASNVGRYVWIPATAGAVMIALGWRQFRSSEESGTITGNPLQLKSALQMAVLFQVVLVLVTLAKQQFGQEGLLVSAAVIGLTDVDALLIAMTRSAQESTALSVAAKAIAIGALANTVLKLGITLVLGRGRFRALCAIGLLVLGAAALVPILFLY